MRDAKGSAAVEEEDSCAGWSCLARKLASLGMGFFAHYTPRRT